MRRISTDTNTFAQDLKRLRRHFQPLDLVLDGKLMTLVQDVIQAVLRNGDAALCEFTHRFDKVELTPEHLRVPGEEIEQAYQRTDETLRRAIQLAVDNVRRYQEYIKVYQQSTLGGEGIELAVRYQALQRVGVCVPGASAPLPSTLVMSAVPAQVAGVKEIVVVSPPRYKGSVHPTVLAACRMLGITEVYRIGGSQAVAALALGTQTIRPVDKIVGPGNVYSQMAKKLLFGVVGIDSFAGPTEIVVLADGSANARFVAADLIGQAEHDPGSAILVTPDTGLADRLEQELPRLLVGFGRKDQAERCLDQYGAIILTRDMNEAVRITNELAPEHLSVQTRNADADAAQCTTAGAVFVGAYTSEALGDYVAGPSHVLPTGGTARFFSPLNVMDFMRHSSIIKYDRAALDKVYPALKALTDAEMLPGHGLSAQVRLE